MNVTVVIIKLGDITIAKANTLEAADKVVAINKVVNDLNRECLCITKKR